MDYYDIVIVGGGAVGLSLLGSLLKKTDLKVLILESRAASNSDQTESKNLNMNQDRFIVLSNSTRKFYQHLGCWQAIEEHCAPIESIEVSAQGQYGTSELKATHITAPALGYVISLYQLEKTLEETLEITLDSLSACLAMGARLVKGEFIETQWQITYTQNGLLKTLNTQCLIGADGKDSLVRTQNQIGITTKSYGHQAIIGTVRVQKKTNQAFERFLSNGAIAFLPLKNQRAVFIWTLPDNEAQAFFQKTESECLIALQAAFGYRLGKLSDLQAKKIFPLNMMRADCQGKPAEKLLLMGSAALSLHPIGAQGLNLSLRNIHLLAQLIDAQKQDTFFCFTTLIQQYLEKIEDDQAHTIWITDKLASYVSGGPFPLPLRALGIVLFDSLPPLKRAFTNLNTGLGVI